MQSRVKCWLITIAVEALNQYHIILYQNILRLDIFIFQMYNFPNQRVFLIYLFLLNLIVNMVSTRR